jgi:hypothetical protein
MNLHEPRTTSKKEGDRRETKDGPVAAAAVMAAGEERELRAALAARGLLAARRISKDIQR